MDKIALKRLRREKLIRSAGPWKATLSICIPTIILMTIQAVYNVVDKYLALAFASPDVLNEFGKAIQLYVQNSVNPISPDQAAGEFINLATQFSGNVFNFLFAFALIVGIGASIVFSIRYGARDDKGMAQSVGNGLIMTLIMSVIIMIVGIILILPNFNYPIFNVQSDIGGRDPIIVNALNQLSYHYSLILCLCTPINFLGYFFFSLFRSEGRLMYIIVVTICCLLLNALLAWIFIAKLHWELYGAMGATACAWTVSLICCLIIVLFAKTTHIKIRRIGLIMNWKMAQQMLVLGLGGFISNISVVIVSMLETNLTGALPGGFGYTNVDGKLQTLYSAISPWLFLTMAPALGIFQGGAALLGYAYGANQYHRCRAIIMRIMWMELIWFTFVYIMFGSVGNYLLAVFDDVEPGHRLLLFLNFLTYPLAFITYTSITFLQSINRGKISMVVSSIRSLIVPVPLIFIAYGISTASGNPIAFFAVYGLADFIAAAIILAIDYYAMRHYNHHFIDMDINKPMDEFQTFGEIDAQYAIAKIKARLERSHSERAKRKMAGALVLQQANLERWKQLKHDYVIRVREHEKYDLALSQKIVK